LGGRPGSWAVSPAGAAWGRGWHGIARFPWLRTARLAVLGAAAGASAEGTWHGTTPLVIVAGIALYVAALDVVEPLAQELDHPDRRDGYPIEAGELYLGLAGPSMVLMVLLCLLGAVVAFAVAGGNLAALEVGLVMALPAAGCALAGAVTSVVQGPPTGGSSTDSMLPPEMAGARAVVRMAWPPLLAIIGVLPVLAVRHPSGHGAATASPVAAVGPWEVLVALLVVAAGVWLRKRERIHASFRDAMAEAAESKRGAPARGR
ncbi:MAG: hypothetical protein ACRDWW_03290, partial [Acidimicrobiales bacterium]